jgi:hypothetical protein
MSGGKLIKNSYPKLLKKKAILLRMLVKIMLIPTSFLGNRFLILNMIKMVGSLNTELDG